MHYMITATPIRKSPVFRSFGNSIIFITPWWPRDYWASNFFFSFLSRKQEILDLRP